MKTLSAFVLISTLFAATATHAVDGDAVLGGALGGGLGAAVGSEVGGRNGAIVGGALGAAVGVAVATDDAPKRDRRVVHVYESAPPAHPGQHVPPGHAKHNHWKNHR